MHRQPKRIRRGPGDPMPDVGWDDDVISSLERERRLISDLQNGCAFDEQHPFVLRLIIPEALGAGLAVGIDALDFDPGFLEESGEDLLGA